MREALAADEWLSGMLGKPAFHLSPTADCAMPVPTPAFIDTKASTADLVRVQALVQAGYQLVDTNVQLERAAGALIAAEVPGTIRIAQPADAHGVRAIATGAFRFDRFHADSNIPQAAADRIKGEWASNYFRGQRGDRMVVVAGKEGIVGFLQIIDRSEFSIIDLIAVAKPAQGCGFAGAMIAHAVAESPTKPWRVGTQVANAPSLRLYERLGFRCVQSHYIFHRHTSCT